MIYSNDDPSSSSKQNNATQQQQRQDPPSYPGPQAYSQPYPYPQVQPYPQPYTYHPEPETVEPAGQRFVKAFMVAAFIWLLLSLLVRTSVSAVHEGWMGDDYSYDIPQGIGLHSCVQGGEWSSSRSVNSLTEATEFAQLHAEAVQYTYESETSTDLPLSSETLFFVTRGQLGGIVHVVTSSEQPRDSLKVHAVIRYDRAELRDLTKACLLSRHDGENGFGIFAPVWHRYPGYNYSISYELTVVLPEGSIPDPVEIKKFETDVPNSSHLLEDLTSRGIFFDSITLRGSNGGIKAKGLRFDKGKIHTSNGPVEGTFFSTEQLFVETSNSPVQIVVGLHNDEDGPLTLDVRSNNGYVETMLGLLSRPGSDSSFDISLKTSNSPLRVQMVASPIDSKLKLDASTTNGAATVLLDPGYEGSFHLRTSNNRPTVKRKYDVRDPKNQGRKRTVAYKTVGKRELIGDIYWGAQKSTNMSVNVRTSNAPVTLEV